MTRKYKVTGMTCSACVAHVERSVSKLDGVEVVNVNLLTNDMNVTFNDKLSESQIIKAVKKAGYGIQDSTPDTDTNTNKNKKTDDTHDMRVRLIVSIIFAVPLVILSMSTMHHADAVNGLTQLLLTIPVVYVNRSYFISGFKKLVSGAPNMDSLIAIGSGASVGYGVYALYKLILGGHAELYFESAATILTLITVGKYLEARAKGKTSEAISKLADLSPDTALVIRGGNEVEIPTGELSIGDIAIVKNGMAVPSDGEIVEGNASFNESALTGESLPVDKSIGDIVTGATVNVSGYVKIKVTKIGGDTVLSQIIRLVEDASATKAPIAKLADKVSGIFVPIVCGIAAVTLITWLIVNRDFETALSAAVSVLVISCPCALGLATPTAIMAGTGKGAEYGVLIKSGEALETAHKINAVILDKTGTITEGKMSVSHIESAENISESQLLTIAAAIERLSEHPISVAIVTEAEHKSLKLPEAYDFQTIPGRGITAKIEEIQYIAGNVSMMQEHGFNVDGTFIYIADITNHIMYGGIEVTDTIKPSSKNAVEEFTKLGIDVYMLTGDNKHTAAKVAESVGITDDHVIAEVLPQDKERKVAELIESGHSVAMVGDGINDAPALVRADVGIAIAAGTDIALEAADIVLMKGDLNDAVTSIKLSRATMRVIKQNLFWAFIYNTIGIPLAALGLTGPMFAAAAMSMSSVCVVSNALRLKFFGKRLK